MATQTVHASFGKMKALEPMTVDSDEFRTHVTGTRDQLLSAGLVTPAHFPGGRKRSAYGRDDKDRFWSLKKVTGGGDRWELMVYHSAADSAAIKVSVREAANRKAQLNELPTSADHARAKLKDALVYLPLEFVVRSASDQFGPASGYSLSEPALREIQALAARMKMIIANAEINFDAEKHASTVANLTQANGVPVRLRAPLRLVAG